MGVKMRKSGHRDCEVNKDAVESFEKDGWAVLDGDTLATASETTANPDDGGGDGGDGGAATVEGSEDAGDDGGDTNRASEAEGEASGLTEAERQGEIDAAGSIARKEAEAKGLKKGEVDKAVVKAEKAAADDLDG